MNSLRPLACAACLLFASAAVASDTGLPSAARPWRAVEYARAAEVLQAGRAPLPRLSDPKGRALVERMTTTENLAHYRDAAVPPRSRFAELHELLERMTAVQALYHADCEEHCAAADLAGKGELARFRAFTLHAAAAQVELADALPPNPDGKPFPRSALDFFPVFTMVEQCLEPGIHSAEDRARLLAAMAATLPRLETCFTAGELLELEERLKARRSRLAAGERPAVGRMLAELRTTLTAAWSGAARNPFVEAGIAPPGRAWRGADYARAAELLRAGRAPLPRRSDPLGGVLFDRLTSPANFSFHRDRSVPVAVRMADLLEVFRGSGDVAQLYLAEFREPGPAPKETGRLLSFVLHLSAALAELVQEAEAGGVAGNLDGARMTVVKMLLQTRNALARPGYLSAEDRSALLATLATTIPRLKHVLSETGRTEFSKEVEELRGTCSKPQHLRAIDAIVAELGKR